MDRLNTRNILKRKNFKIQDNDYNCVLCDLKRAETTFHLFFHCPFSKRCWQKININWNYQTDFFTTFEQARQTHGSIYFMATFIIAAWQIWKQRNNFIFDRGRPSLDSWKANFIAEAFLQASRLPIGKQHDFISYVNNLFV
jgi:uncharacterized protein YbcV (DUF1398 family)